MAVYIESRFNDGYIAHHSRDMIYVMVVHRPQDGYFLAANKEVIKERMELREFIIRLVKAEHPGEAIPEQKIDNDYREIQGHLMHRKEREIAEWLDHRYARLINSKQIVLMQHSHIPSVDGTFYDRETISNTERIKRQVRDTKWDEKLFHEEMERQGLKIKDVVEDDDVYYMMTP